MIVGLDFFRYDTIPEVIPVRIIFTGRTKRRTQAGMHLMEAFRRAGCEVKWLRSTWVEKLFGPQWLIARARRFQPDMLFLYTHLPSFPMVEALLADGVPLLFFLPSVHREPAPEILDLARKSTVFFINNQGQFDLFREQGCRDIRFLTQGFDPATHYPERNPNPRWRSEVAFIGRCRRGDGRSALIESLKRQWDVKVYGLGWEDVGLSAVRRVIYPPQYRAICASSGIILGSDTQPDIPLCFSNRTWLTLGCGAFLLTSYVPRLEDLFENHKHLVWYRSPEECQEMVEYYLAHPEERKQIAQAGHQLVMENYTYDHIVKRILDAFFEKTGISPQPTDILPHP